MTTKKPIPIYFDEDTFNKMAEKFNNKNYLSKMLTAEFRKLLNNPNLEQVDFANALAEFYFALGLEKKEQNTLDLPGDKLAQLLSIDTATITKLQTEYIKVKDATQPDAHKFTIYAETPEEIAKYTACVNVIKAIDEFKPYLCQITGQLQYFAFEKAFSFLLKFNLKKQKFEFNHQFIKAN